MHHDPNLSVSADAHFWRADVAKLAVSMGANEFMRKQPTWTSCCLASLPVYTTGNIGSDIEEEHMGRAHQAEWRPHRAPQDGDAQDGGAQDGVDLVGVDLIGVDLSVCRRSASTTRSSAKAGASTWRPARRRERPARSLRSDSGEYYRRAWPRRRISSTTPPRATAVAAESLSSGQSLERRGAPVRQVASKH